MASLLRVFVYGTLKPGECNYDRYCAASVVEVREAMVYGQLFDLPFGYPAMTLGNSPVYGFVLSFAERTVLKQLDELEDYAPDRPADQNEYIRIETQTFSLDHQPLDPAWVYLMDLEQAKRSGGIFLPSGCWTGSRARL
jgi:gamma-glutamylcyclotransferase (GGCT)/AIG2-like uncharacterized protein YtfP